MLTCIKLELVLRHSVSMPASLRALRLRIIQTLDHPLHLVHDFFIAFELAHEHMQAHRKVKLGHINQVCHICVICDHS